MEWKGEYTGAAHEIVATMTTPERELTIEITCTDPPDAAWPEGGTLHLGIQKDDKVHEPTPLTEARLVFRPVLRVRRHADGSANFLGPFAHGPRTERFIYLNWMAVKDGTVCAMPGRIKLHLSQIPWNRVESAVNAGKPIRVTLALCNAKGKPVFASVREGLHWDL